MKFLNISSILSTLAVLNFVQSRAISKDDGYYLIYVNNTYSEGSGNQKREQFINTVMEEIQTLIEDNKDTFKNPKELDILEENNAALRKRSGSETSYVHEVSSLDDTTVLSSYFSYDVNEKVKHLPGILGSEPKRKMSFGVPDEKILYHNRRKSKRDNDENVIENITEKIDEFVNEVKNSIEDVIIKEHVNQVKLSTGWKEVGVRENTDLHLSLMSQGLFNGTSQQYDTTYYFPKKEGEGIDIYVIDSGFNFRHPEFSNKDERTVKCIGIISNGKYIEPEAEDYCISNNIHGELTSDCVGGIKHGSASKANIYGIGLTIEGREGEENNNENFLLSLDYVLNNIKMKPHKSIITMSMGGFFSLADTEFYNYMQKIFNKFTELGVISFVSAGNGGRKVYDKENDAVYLPCALNGVICVGAIDSNGSDRDPTIPNELYYSNKMLPINYARANFSNYGEQVKIYGPGYALAEFQDWEYNVVDLFVGTSFTTPLVAGIAATVMSEHTDIEFDTSSMASYLALNGQQNILANIPEGKNIFINNGNKSVLMRSIPAEDFNDEQTTEGFVEEQDINENDNTNVDEPFTEGNETTKVEPPTENEAPKIEPSNKNSEAPKDEPLPEAPKDEPLAEGLKIEPSTEINETPKVEEPSYENTDYLPTIENDETVKNESIGNSDYSPTTENDETVKNEISGNSDYSPTTENDETVKVETSSENNINTDSESSTDTESSEKKSWKREKKNKKVKKVKKQKKTKKTKKNN